MGLCECAPRVRDASHRLAELAREDERHAEAEAFARVGRQEGGEQREDREEDRRHEKVVIVLRRARV